MPQAGDLVLTRGLLRQLSTADGRHALAVALAAEAAVVPIRSRLPVAIVEVWCAPGRAVAAILGSSLHRRPKLLLWAYPWLVVLTGVGVVQQCSMGRSPVAVGLMVVATVLLVAPRWSRTWELQLGWLRECGVRTAGLASETDPHDTRWGVDR